MSQVSSLLFVTHSSEDIEEVPNGNYSYTESWIIQNERKENKHELW